MSAPVTNLAGGRATKAASGSLPRLLSERDGTLLQRLADHLAVHGPLPSWSGPAAAERLIAEVGRAGLRGRGGAGYPTHRKLRAVRDQRRRAVVIANGTEGEPASAKDRVLLAVAPHLVIDGAVVAAQAVAAREVVLVVRPEVRTILDSALAERDRARVDPVAVRAITSAPGFVAGESSAVVSWVGGRAPLPRMTPPRLAERGLDGRPTLVQNVETLAHLALIGRQGAAWFRAIGQDAEPGSLLVTLAGAVASPGVYEVPFGIPLGDLLELARGPSEPPSALLVGGYSGSWVSMEEAEGLDLSTASLASVGASPGAGLIGALPRRGACGLMETARLVGYLACQSAGQCGPCVFGLRAIADELESVAHSSTFDATSLWRWLDQVDGRGACSHPDGVVRLVRSALRVFADEVHEHQQGWCRGRTDVPLFPVGRPSPLGEVGGR